MAEQAVRSSSDAVDPQPRITRWRTVDIVVTAVLGVAFGVVFWAWNLLWAATGTAFTAFPPAQAAILAWNDGIVGRLAARIHKERDFAFESMGVLADALPDGSRRHGLGDELGELAGGPGPG